MIKGKGIHYVIATYFGRRRAEYAPQMRDRMLFITRHLESLARLKHSIDRITLVVQVDSDGISNERTDAIAATCKLLKLRDVHMSVRPNDHGLSYSALAHATRLPIARTFEYTIFNEDDYVFAIDDFDRYLVEKLERNPNASYLSGCERLWDGVSHAAVCTGIAHTARLRDLPTSYSKAVIPQVAWSHELLKRGPIIDWLDDYATAFRLDDDGVRWIERSAPSGADPFTMPAIFRRALLVPVQAIDMTERGAPGYIHYWHDAFVRRQGNVSMHGAIAWGADPTEHR